MKFGEYIVCMNEVEGGVVSACTIEERASRLEGVDD
jgi:hypothetical protein